LARASGVRSEKTNPVPSPVGQGAEEVLRVAVPGPEQHELQVPAEDALQGVGEDVEPLLRGQPADDREQRRARAHGQPRLALERRLALGLAPERVGREVRREVRVGRGIPRLHVDAVQDPEEIGVPRVEDPVEAAAVGGGLDLAGIGGAHGREHGGVVEGGLHEVQRAEVLELAGVVVVLAEPGDEHRATVGDTLVGEVVDRVDGRGAVEGARPLHRVHVDRDERGLPVVGVDDVGQEVQRLRELERAAREEGEPLEVVLVLPAGRAIDVRAVEEAVVLEEVDGDVARRQPPQPHPGARRAPPHRDLDRAVQPLERVPVHPRVEGRHHAHVEAEAAQRLGERAHDVGQAARLGEGGHLGADDQDSQGAELVSH
jgi:hypothetical protein